MSGQSTALLFGQDLRPQAEQGVGLCLLQERLRQRYLACHYLLIDQADCDAMSALIRRASPYIKLKPMILGPLMLLRPFSREFPDPISLPLEIT